MTKYAIRTGSTKVYLVDDQHHIIGEDAVYAELREHNVEQIGIFCIGQRGIVWSSDRFTNRDIRKYMKIVHRQLQNEDLRGKHLYFLRKDAYENLRRAVLTNQNGNFFHDQGIEHEATGAITQVQRL